MRRATATPTAIRGRGNGHTHTYPSHSYRVSTPALGPIAPRGNTAICRSMPIDRSTRLAHAHSAQLEIALAPRTAYSQLPACPAHRGAQSLES